MKRIHWHAALCIAIKGAWAVGIAAYRQAKGLHVRAGDKIVLEYTVIVTPGSAWWRCHI